MVAGEDAEPARIYGQAFRKPELERKVSHRERRLCVHEPRMALVVLAIGRPRAVECLANVLTFAGALHAALSCATWWRRCSTWAPRSATTLVTDPSRASPSPTRSRTHLSVPPVRSCSLASS